MRCTALDCALPPTREGPGFLQVIGYVGDTTNELAMIPGAPGAFCNEVRDCAAALEQGIGDPRIAAINNKGGTQIRIGTIIRIVRHAVPIAVGLLSNGLALARAACRANGKHRHRHDRIARYPWDKMRTSATREEL